MKQPILFVIAISLGLSYAAQADNYDILAAKGHRRVAIHGHYDSTTEQGVERIINRRSGRTGSQILEDEQVFYLNPDKAPNGQSLLKDVEPLGVARILKARSASHAVNHTSRKKNEVVWVGY
jgi:hypothetical protein